MDRTRNETLPWAAAQAVAVLCALAAGLTSCILYPTPLRYTSLLRPEGNEATGYERGDEGTVSYYVEGSRIDVRHMTDQELNAIFADDSKGRKLSTNPYTYGDWVDPNRGYIPNRFTVFEVSIYNFTLPKMMLDPTRAILKTDHGKQLQSYTVAPTADRNSLEGYYRALRRISGNEYYRFAKRIGIVRSTIYGEDEILFKGEQYSGYIVFDPLDPKVGQTTLVLRDLGVRFDAYNRPVETIDIPFSFDRQVQKEVVIPDASVALAATKVSVRGPSDLVGNQPGDLARDVGAANSVVDGNLTDLNACFEPAYVRQEAVEGQISVAFTIKVNGEVVDVTVAASTVMHPGVESCVLQEVNGWRFQPAGRFEVEALTPQGDVAATPRRTGRLVDVRVVYPFEFSANE